MRKLHTYIYEETGVSLFRFLLPCVILRINISLLDQKKMNINNVGIVSNDQDVFVRKSSEHYYYRFIYVYDQVYFL